MLRSRVRVLATHSIRQFPLHSPPLCVTVCHHIPNAVYCKYQCTGQGKKCDHQVPSPWCTDILICIFLPLLAAAAAHAVHSSTQPRSSNCSSWQINRNWFNYNDKNNIISYNMCKISGYIIKSFSFLTFFFSESIHITTYVLGKKCIVDSQRQIKKNSSICGSLHYSTIPLISLLIVQKSWIFSTQWKKSPERVCRTHRTSDWKFHHWYWFYDFILCWM